MPDLNQHKFCELYEMSSGISSSPEQAGHGSPFLSFSTVFNNYFLPTKLNDLMHTSEIEQKKYSIKEGDIFLTRTSETIDELGMSSVALKDYPNATYSGFLKRLRPTQKDITYHKFMAFYLRSRSFRKVMTNNAVLTLRASLNEDIFSYINLLLPDYGEQVKIGDLLHLLSQKIDINNRINAELEAMAKTLYDYWFVQFDFPDENGKPYKSSGGKMEYNPILKREIPTGWNVVKLSEVFQNVSESIQANQIKAPKPYTPIDSLPLKKMSFGDYEPSSEAKTSLIQYKRNDILIGAMRVYFHRVCIAPFDGITRTTTMVLRSKNEERMPYLYQVCNEDRLIAHATRISGGTQQPYVNWDNALSEYRFAYPENISLITKYSDKVRPIIDSVILRENENNKLKKLMDWLLPMLINGQVQIASGVNTIITTAEYKKTARRKG